MATDRIEDLIQKEAWKDAQKAIEKELVADPENHWLWSRLATVRHEQRDYEGALDAAQHALTIVPDCPLALWSAAGAHDMLGQTTHVAMIYFRLIRKGLSELRQPDEDANECWEGSDWTKGLLMDSLFRLGGCLAKMGHPEDAILSYELFLDMIDDWPNSIYSRKEALSKLDELRRRERSRTSSIEESLEGALERLGKHIPLIFLG